MMKLSKSQLFTSLVTCGLLALSGCGNDDGKSDVQSDRSAQLETDLSELEAELERLKAQLSEDPDNQDLLDQIAALEDELNALKSCAQGGACASISEAAEYLRPVVEAMCESITSCCTEGQLRHAAGERFVSQEACVDSFMAVAESGNAPVYGGHYSYRLDAPFDINLPYTAELSQALLKGKVEINQAGIDACAEQIKSIDCSYESIFESEGSACGSEREASACEIDKMVTGLSKESEECFYLGESNRGSCEEGLHCEWIGEDSAICVANGATGSNCNYNYQCNEDSYCNGNTFTCEPRLAKGESCEFLYDFEKLDGDYNYLVTECEIGLLCDPYSHTCVSNCDEDIACGEGFNCGPGQYCSGDEDGSRSFYAFGSYHDYDYRQSNYIYGTCVDYEESSSCYDDSQCDSNSWCADGACQPKIADEGECGYDNSCVSGLCYYGSCETPASGSNCSGSDEYAARICGDAEFCDGETCVAEVALGGDCEPHGDIACGSEAFCRSSDNTCQPRVQRGASCDQTAYDQTQSVEESPEQRNCAEGLMCAGYMDSSETDHYVCLPPRDAEGARAEGEYCGPLQNAQSGQRCESGRCRMVDGEEYGVCDAGLPVGSACDAEEAWDAPYPQRVYRDDCAPGSYCKPTDPQNDDYSGTCVAQVKSGMVCDLTLEELAQCEGDYECEEGYNGNFPRCPAVDDNMLYCTFDAADEEMYYER